MEPKEVAEWAMKRACCPCRKSVSYEHKACIEPKEIHDWLSSAATIDDQLSNGQRISGFLIQETPYCTNRCIKDGR
jgi:hypothetical protein